MVITAPARTDITVVLRVNEQRLTRRHELVSNASCTTNCLATVAKVLLDSFGIKRGSPPQSSCTKPAHPRLPHKDLRRARAGASVT